VTFSKFEGHFLFETFLIPITPEIYCMLPTVCCLHMDRKVHVVCNFKYIIETEGLLKVTSSYLHCYSSSISEMVQDIVTAGC